MRSSMLALWLPLYAPALCIRFSRSFSRFMGSASRKLSSSFFICTLSLSRISLSTRSISSACFSRSPSAAAWSPDHVCPWEAYPEASSRGDMPMPLGIVGRGDIARRGPLRLAALTPAELVADVSLDKKELNSQPESSRETGCTLPLCGSVLGEMKEWLMPEAGSAEALQPGRPGMLAYDALWDMIAGVAIIELKTEGSSS